MSGKRKDSKGRNLRTGESQRKDLVYQYRYTDQRGRRQTVYAPDLNTLREKEKKIQKDLDDGIDYSAGEAPVIDLITKYISFKGGVRYNTSAMYELVIKLVKEFDLGYMQIKDVKMSDAKTLMISLHNSGRSFNTIDRVKSVLKPAFKVAVDDDIIRKNPFDFSLTEVVKKDEKHRVALTPEQQNQWMTFVRNDRTYSRYYDEFLVLLETGMRVSELCGLTISDLDFKNRKIYINRQLQKEDDGTYYIGETKSESGKRIVPMNDNVYVSLQNIVKNRKAPEVETMVDGCCGFILLTRTGKPKTSENIQETIRWARRKYKKVHPESPLPDITPHVFRHTFCTNMANSGMSVKSLQYLMGHSESSTTLDVYAHPDYDIAEKEMTKIMSFESAKNNKKKQIS